MTSPLDFPEILLNIGLCIPLWSRDDPRLQVMKFRPPFPKKFKMHPQDLVACTSVNRMWRCTLLPLLWAVYEDLEMKKWVPPTGPRKTRSWYGSLSFNNWDIPADILEAQSIHFKYVALYRPWPPGTLKATKIRDLTTTSDVLQANMDLLRSNPQLSVLNLKCCSGLDFDTRYPAFESVTSLKSLQMSYVIIRDPTRFVRFLNNNYGLEELMLSRMEGLVVFEGCERLKVVQWPREPWSCLQLEKINLGGFVFPHDVSSLNDRNLDLDEGEDATSHHSKIDTPFLKDISSQGWVHPDYFPDTVLISADMRLMRKWIFEQTRSFSKLYRIIAESYEYLNMDRMPHYIT
ncbi:hypothetical protein EMPS_06967 [Entomortierella parvispora]|uniref:F-box domain-containing protein n=1 Tax=Entomortierella parvispora TaxID=205924 RepID=A0A9P3HDE2_9FUNG|nr:hypothetical protein EMPS_06967 [Entomortierella parvispora]